MACSRHLPARKDPVQTYQINISQGRDNVHGIRRALFAFSEILDVFVTSRPDSLVVVCAGRPRLGEWLRALRSVGYEIPTRAQAAAAATKPSSIGRIRPKTRSSAAAHSP